LVLHLANPRGLSVKAVLKNAKFQVKDIVAAAVGIALIAEGLYVVSISAWTTVEKLRGDYLAGGGVLGQTVTIAGIQLMILGIVLVSIWMLRTLKPMAIKRVFFGINIGDLSILAAGFIAALEGLYVMYFASLTTIERFGTIRGGTVSIAGFQLFLLGAIAILALSFKIRHSDPRGRRLTLGSIVLLLLLLPPALFL